EVVAGSTGRRAGTAQKAVLGSSSAGIMIRRGSVYEGRVVAMRISNAKLLQRGRGMVQDIAGVDAEAAAQALEAAGNEIRSGAIVASGVPVREGQDLLDANGGTPLYSQSARSSREHISSGAIDPGSALPSERDLSEMAGLSRVTVRKGIEQLIDEGV
ncbi:hypothetical protein OY671_010033, partial [Metschnikowia pulcherrima]